MFRLLGFAKLSRKNRAAKNLRHSGEIATSQIQRRSALFIRKNCAAKDSRCSSAIAKLTLNMGQQQLPRKNSTAKNFWCSGAIAKPKIKHKSATITAQSNAAKNLRHSGTIAKPKMKQGSATITTLTKVHNPRKIRAAAQYLYNPPPYSPLWTSASWWPLLIDDGLTFWSQIVGSCCDRAPDLTCLFQQFLVQLFLAQNHQPLSFSC